jgi:hypothetical protein
VSSACAAAFAAALMVAFVDPTGVAAFSLPAGCVTTGFASATGVGEDVEEETGVTMVNLCCESECDQGLSSVSLNT